MGPRIRRSLLLLVLALSSGTGTVLAGAPQAAAQTDEGDSGTKASDATGVGAAESFPGDDEAPVSSQSERGDDLTEAPDAPDSTEGVDDGDDQTDGEATDEGDDAPDSDAPGDEDDAEDDAEEDADTDDPEGDGAPADDDREGTSGGSDVDDLAPFEPQDEPEQTGNLMATAATSAAVATAAAAAARAGSARSGASRGSAPAVAARSDGTPAPDAKGQAASENPEFAEVYAGDIAFIDPSAFNAGRGDRSRTWKAPLTPTVDRVSTSIPLRISRYSPLAGGIAADGTWLRAIVGSVASVLPVAGVVLGIAAGIDGGGRWLPPALGLVIAITIVGIADALAGAAAAASYLVTTAILGGLPSVGEFRAALGLAVLFFVPVLISGATRPLRRPLDGTWDTRLDRLGDLVIGPMMATWCAQGFAYGQQALTGRKLPLADEYVMIGWIVFAALVARLLAESAVVHFYPVRLAATEPGTPDEPTPWQRRMSLAGRVLMFVGIANAFFPWSWQLLFAASAMAFGVFGYWESFVSRLPNWNWLFRWIPTGLPMMVLWLFATERLAQWLASGEPDPSRRLLNTFAYMAAPTLVFTMLAALGREGERPKLELWHRLAAIPLLGLAAHVMFGWFPWITATVSKLV